MCEEAETGGEDSWCFGWEFPSHRLTQDRHHLSGLWLLITAPVWLWQRQASGCRKQKPIIRSTRTSEAA